MTKSVYTTVTQFDLRLCLQKEYRWPHKPIWLGAVDDITEDILWRLLYAEGSGEDPWGS